MHILIVEDDHKLAMQMAEFLQQHGYQISTVADGLQAVNQILQLQPQLVLLDVMLPGADGFSVCRQVRSQFSGEILMLTACSDDIDQVAGLECGADDYLAKPINPRVLLARIRVAQRRMQHSVKPSAGESDGLTVGQLQLRASTRSALIQQQLIALSPSEFDLLYLLAQHVDVPVSRDELFRALRGFEYDGVDRSIDSKIVSLRKKLGDDPSNPQHIITVRGKGYCLVSQSWG